MGFCRPIHPVACRIERNGADCTRGLTRREHRARGDAPPPIRQSPFLALADAGATPEAIAARFGVSERVVAQRLRLGAIAPGAPRRVPRRADEPRRPERVRPHHRSRPSARGVGRAGGPKPRPDPPGRSGAGSPRAGFPPRAALAQFRRGSRLRSRRRHGHARDLFAEEHEKRIVARRARTLAPTRQGTAGDRSRGPAPRTGPGSRYAWSSTGTPRRATGGSTHDRRPPTEAERTEHERLRERLDALERLQEWGRRDRSRVRTRAASACRGPRRGARGTGSVPARRPRARAGCIVTVARDGALDVLAGGWCAETTPRATQPGKTPDTTKGHQPHARTARGATPAGIGVALGDDLRAIRTSVVKAELACDFEAAFDLLLFELARNVFGRDGAGRFTADQRRSKPRPTGSAPGRTPTSLQ